jgi:hypothetical protein
MRIVLVAITAAVIAFKRKWETCVDMLKGRHVMAWSASLPVPQRANI